MRRLLSTACISIDTHSDCTGRTGIAQPDVDSPALVHGLGIWDTDPHIHRLLSSLLLNISIHHIVIAETRMWANAQRDVRPAEYRWRSLFNAAKFG